MLASDHDLLSREDVRLEGPREVLDEHGGAAPICDLVRALGVEELAGSLGAGGDALGAGHGYGVVCAELDVGVEEVVGDGVGGGGEALGAAGVVGEEVAGGEGGEGRADGGEVEGRWGHRHVADIDRVGAQGE